MEATMLKKLMGTSNDVSLTILRVVLGVVFFAHGAQKMLGWFGGYGFHGTMGFFTHMGMAAPVAFLVICTEFFGGLGLIVGLLTRIAALGIGGEMIGAVLMGSPAERVLHELGWESEGRGIRISPISSGHCGSAGAARGGGVVGRSGTIESEPWVRCVKCTRGLNSFLKDSVAVRNDDHHG
jgi:uncharacterized membrane protein YphA (DoxX/SURF4 family)